MTSAEASDSLELLLKQLLSKSEPVTVRVEAATKLSSLESPQAINALLEVVHQESEPRLLMHVVGILGRKKVYRAVMPLIDLMLCTGKTEFESDHSENLQGDVGIRVRVAVVQALGKMGDERAIVPLMSLLNDPKENYRIRLAAAESLGRLGDSQALNPLLNIVQDDQEASQYLKESAVKALGMLGDIRALEPLLDMFESQKGFKNKFKFLKEQLIEAIGRLGTSHNRAQKALLDALNDETSYIRLAAVESLADVGDESCIPHLIERLFDPDNDVAVAAVSTLFKLGGESLIRRILDEQVNLPQFVREELECYVP